MLESALQAMKAHREKLLYLVVGGWNTAFQYACFSILYYLLHARLPASLIVLFAYFVSSVNGFLGFRYIVFQSSGHPGKEYLRFQIVYLPFVVANMVALPLAISYFGANAYVFQAAWAAFSVVVGYLGNRFFVFRRPGSRV